MKRESEATGEGNGRRHVDESAKNKGVDDSVPIDEPPTQEEDQGISDRRILRSQYLALIHKISGTYTLSLIRLFRLEKLWLYVLFCRF